MSPIIRQKLESNTIVGERYFELLIDDYSRMTLFTFLIENFKELDRFKAFS